MLSLSKIILAATAFFAVVVSASPVAQDAPEAVAAVETKIPKVKAYHGKDPNQVPVPKTTASPTPSPRYTAPIKIVSDLK